MLQSPALRRRGPFPSVSALLRRAVWSQPSLGYVGGLRFPGASTSFWFDVTFLAFSSSTWRARSIRWNHPPLPFGPGLWGSSILRLPSRFSVKLCILRSLDLQIQSLSCTSASALEFFTCYLRFAPQIFCLQPPCGCCLLRSRPVSSAAPSDGPVTHSARVSFRSLAFAWLPPPSAPLRVLWVPSPEGLGGQSSEESWRLQFA